MPRDDNRRSSNARPPRDNRPSFARPPGASAARTTPKKPEETYSPREKRRSRVVETYDDDETSEESSSSDSNDYDGHNESPAPRPRRDIREKAKSSPAVSPQKDRRRRPSRDPESDRDRGVPEERRRRTETERTRYKEDSQDRTPTRDRPRQKEADRDRDRDRGTDKNADKRRPREKDAYRNSPTAVDPTRKHKRKASAPVGASPRAEKLRDRDRVKYSSGTSTGSASKLLSSDALTRLNMQNTYEKQEEQKRERKKQEREKANQYKNLRGAESAEKKRRKKNRDVSGAILEEGRAAGRARRRGGGGSYDDDEYDEKAYIVKTQQSGKRWNMTKKKWIVLGVLVALLIIIIAVGAVVSNKKKSAGGGSGGGGSAVSVKNDCDSSGVPASAKGTYTDISTWLDTTDFNCSYTAEEVGGLSVMGLNSNWDDSKSANSNTPPLNKAWDYTKTPARGVNMGGWLSLEPYITPSLFNYPSSQNVVDEYTLSAKLGGNAARALENHYATYITKQDFKEIADAGLDHVRIPFGYWAVTTYQGDPFVPKISWRYLLRGIEYARENGLRVNLDLHGAPGSQNGWAHSGHQGEINWIAGAGGAQNAQRTLDIHNQLSKFFSQDRYKNVVTMYGLVNEPYMLTLDHNSVMDWSKKAIDVVRGNGVQQDITFHDGFLALDDWSDMFKNVDPNLMLDTHQYQIFNIGQLKLQYADKIKVACSGWAGMIGKSNNPSTGWGPTICGEWSQADTDCTPFLNNVTAGNRWTGTLNTGMQMTSVVTPSCPNPPCSCNRANSDPGSYSSSYKKFLQMYAEAQMHAFEQGSGWFYWTWKTESAVQWSWKLGRQAGILPQKAYAPSFKCDSAVPDFKDL